ncbi:hypothetical protein BC835DRAFT_1413385 [Cytidiella melzeri]|nr:hypothetical protein BC835DRAFT_1413385 [Cytidiella melzeri]
MASITPADKARCRAALDVLATRNLYFEWSPNWSSVHDGNTSQLEGLKPGSRRDSAGARLYWVGLLNVSGKRVQPPAVVQASFANPPSSAEAIAALRALVGWYVNLFVFLVVLPSCQPSPKSNARLYTSRLPTLRSAYVSEFGEQFDVVSVRSLNLSLGVCVRLATIVCFDGSVAFMVSTNTDNLFRPPLFVHAHDVFRHTL